MSTFLATPSTLSIYGKEVGFLIRFPGSHCEKRSHVNDVRTRYDVKKEEATVVPVLCTF